MKLRYGGGAGGADVDAADAAPQVKVRESQRGEWREADTLNDTLAAAGEAAAAAGEVATAAGSTLSRRRQPEDLPDLMMRGAVILPDVPPPCEASWEDGGDGEGGGDATTRVLAVRVPLPAGTGAGDCSAEVEPSPIRVGGGAGAGAGGDRSSSSSSSSSHLILEAPGLPGGVARITLPMGSDDDSIAIKLVKKPQRALVVRLRCPSEAVEAPSAAADDASLEPPPSTPPTPAPASTPAQPPTKPNPQRESAAAAKATDPKKKKQQQQQQKQRPPPPPPKAAAAAAAAGKDCVGVGGTLSWSAATEFSPLPPVPPPAHRSVAPRGVDLRDAGDWEDYVQVRWAIAGCEDQQPVLTPHALDGLSFPVTLAWALQQKPVTDAIAAARAAAASAAASTPVADVAAAAAAAAAGGGGAGGGGAAATAAEFGDGKAGMLPLTVIIAGASQFTEQYLLDHTKYWEEVTVAAPQPRGGDLAFVGPDVQRRRSSSRSSSSTSSSSSSSSTSGLRRLSPSLTASVHDETVRAYLARLPSSAPAMLMGFNTGMGGGGGALARGWSADLVDVLRRSGVPAVFTAANDYADLRGELAVFKALGARFTLPPRSNPLRAYTYTIAEGDGAAGLRARPPDHHKNPGSGGGGGGGGGGDTDGGGGGERWSCANAFVYAVQGFQPGKGLDGGLSETQLCALAAGAAERAAGAAWDALGMKR